MIKIRKAPITIRLQVLHETQYILKQGK